MNKDRNEKDTITVRLDPETKRQAQELFDDLGISLSSAVNLFLKQAIREGKIPFEIKRDKPAGRKVKPLHKLK
ncbi:MAG: type II toxin-antitoxin system RelB/DinJ family antitoxin [Bacilli bacterium]|jgi:DNA-damage-inducible protein J|nr:type II toxin-antitoxin system RelB/DinJ family antitoxin [Bacilli bacterium]MCH4211131.1 type II toxin-antitoxin system RelB/DinJ family antitoxin [Bacilli bacterium]MCH4228981.1 type II toxin-antitoxin system RelB/DinJ family antitoxin [Bacilli bacterium]MCH4277371.1 type II toxin-antitoxin system RelB/DinJ family antitoxin [Bacilli bacterium]MCI2055166.1 type II toxin-antitoxin system RelB/DinJ family antitoxin [Bacilli bacterium]